MYHDNNIEYRIKSSFKQKDKSNIDLFSSPSVLAIGVTITWQRQITNATSKNNDE